MIELSNLTVKFDGQSVIEELDFTFADGVFYGITGVSGIGKTTLLNVIAGLLSPTDGKISNSFEKTAYVFQEARLFPWLTALENVECVCKDRERARYYTELLLPSGINKYPEELSGGMKQRVAIARALAYDAPLLLLDEPFKGLDLETKELTLKAVTEHIRERTAILVSHTPSELALCDAVYSTGNSPISSLTEVKDVGNTPK